MSAGRKPTLNDLERLCQNLAALDLPTKSSQNPTEFTADESLLDTIAGRLSGLEANIGASSKFADIWRQTFETMKDEFLATAEQGQLSRAIEGMDFIVEQAANNLSPHHDVCLDAIRIGGILKFRAGQLNESLRTLCHGLKLAIAAKGSHSKTASLFLHEIDALPLPLMQRISMLSQFARTVDRHHQLDICYGEVSRGKMYATYLDAIVMTHGSKAPGLVGNLILDESPSSMIRSNALSVPADRFISKEIQLLGQLLVTILNNSATNEQDSELPWWKRLSNPAVVAPVDIPNVARLRSIITLALENKPHRQFPTARDFAEALEDYLSGSTSNYGYENKRDCLLAWRTGILLNKCSRQLSPLEAALTSMDSIDQRPVSTEILSLASAVAEGLDDMQPMLATFPRGLSYLSGNDAVRYCRQITQLLRSAESHDLLGAIKLFKEWQQVFVAHPSAHSEFTNWFGCTLLELASHAEAVISSELIAEQWCKFAGGVDVPQEFIDRVGRIAKSIRESTDLRAGVDILNQEIVSFLRWSSLPTAIKLPLDLSYPRERDPRFDFDSLWTSISTSLHSFRTN